jgi:hypothetical protein
MKLITSWDLLHGKTTDKKESGRLYQPIQMTPLEDKDEDWIHSCVDWYEDLGIRQLSMSYNRHIKNYEHANGVIDKSDYIKDDVKERDEDYNNILSSIDTEFVAQKEPELLDLTYYPIIPSIIKVLTGEFSKRYQKVTIEAVDQFSKNEKVEAKFEKIKEYVVNQNKMKLFSNLMESGFQFESEEQLQEVQKEIDDQVMQLPQVQELFRKSYRSQIEQWAQHQLDVDERRFSMYEMENKGFRDYIITDSQFWHINLKEDDYAVELWNPINTFFHLSPEVKYVSEGNYVGRITMMSIPDLIDRYGYMMKEDDLERIENVYQSSILPKPGGARPEEYYDTSRPYHDQFPNDMRIQKAMANNSMSMSGYSNFYPHHRNFENFVNLKGDSYDDTMVRVTDVYWKSQKRLGYLTKVSEDGVPSTEIITENYKVTRTPIYDNQFYKENSKKNLIYGEHIDWFWINEVWGATKVSVSLHGGNSWINTNYNEPLYLNAKPIKFQFKGENDLWDARLPVEGIAKSDIRLSQGVSLIDLVKPYQVMYNAVNNQIKDLLIDEIGTVILLDQNALPSSSMGEDWGDNNLGKAYMAMKDFSMLPVDFSMANMGERTSFNQFQQLNLEQTNRFMSRLNIGQWAKNEALATIGITPQRIGQVTSQETATGVTQAVNSSYAQTESYFVEHINFLMPRLKNMMINAAQYYNATNPSVQLQYMTKDNESVMFEIDGYKLLARNLQVYTAFTPDSKELMEQMRLMVLQNNTTNANIYDLLSIASAKTPSEVIERAKKSVDDFERQTQEQRAHEQEMLDKQLQATQMEKQADQAFEADQNERDRVKDLTEAQIRALGFSNDTDLNQDETPDLLQIEKFNAEEGRFQQKMQIERERLINERQKTITTQSLKQQELQTRKEIADKHLQIARENKNKYDKPAPKTPKKK